MTASLKYNARKACERDLVTMAKVTRVSWLGAFRSFVPTPILDRGTDEYFEELWRDILTNSSKESAIVIEYDGEIVACGACGVYRVDYNPPLVEMPQPNAGELYRGYVHPEFQSQGVGKTLFLYRLKTLAERGCKEVYGWVDEQNSPARAFFDHLGGRIVGSGDKVIDAYAFPQVCYLFQPEDAAEQ